MDTVVIHSLRSEPQVSTLSDLRNKLGQRFQSLPPFWSAFAMTLTETVGAGILALPVAMAVIGPLAGIAILVIMGIINIVTIACMAEAVARSLSFRTDGAFIGAVVSEYLGPVAARFIALGLAAAIFLALWAYYIGLSATLAEVIGLPPLFWVAVIFLINLYFVARGGLRATITSALIIGCANVALLLFLVALALPHIEPELLLRIDLSLSSSGETSVSALGLIFGVVVSAYFGHVSVSNSAKIILPRDPGGKHLIWGSAAGTFGAMILNCLWLIAVNGVLSPDILVQEMGTALVPLAEIAGPGVKVAGMLFAILAMGMTSIHLSQSLVNLTREQLQASVKLLPSSLTHFLSQRGHFALSIAPIVLVFLLSIWSLLTGIASFSTPLSFLGTVVGSMFIGVLPPLLLLSSRRHVHYMTPTHQDSWGNPLLFGSIVAFYLASFFAHGLLIWQDSIQQAVVLAAA